MGKPFSSRLTPFGEYVLVRKSPPPSKVAGPPGLLVVESDPSSGKVVTAASGQRHSLGTVVAVGDGVWHGDVKVPLPFAVGSTVMFDPSNCFQFKDVPEMASEGLWWIGESFIIAKLEPEGLHKGKVNA